MELFGKTIDIQMDERQEKILTYVVGGIVIALLTYFLIIKPALVIKANKEFYESEIIRHEQVTQKLKKTKEKRDLQVKKYEEQKENYDKLVTKMDNASLQNNAILKEVVQRMMDESNVEMLTIGAMESGGSLAQEAYEKRFIPYTASGKGRDMTRLFYYLENSEWLITLRGSVINLSRSGSGEDESVSAQFKLGAYYPKEGTVKKEE